MNVLSTLLTNFREGLQCNGNPVKVNNVFADVKWFFPKIKIWAYINCTLEYGDKPQNVLTL